MSAAKRSGGKSKGTGARSGGAGGRSASGSKKSSARRKTSKKTAAKRTTKTSRSAGATKSATKGRKKATARSKSAGKATGKKSVKKTTKKKTQKKATKRTTAGGSSRKNSARKTAARKKTTTKKATAKKTTARRTTGRTGSTAKKTTARRTRPPKLSKATLTGIAEKLQSDLADLERQLEELQEEAASESEDGGLNEDFADAGTSTFDRERDLSIRYNVEDLIDQVRRALARIDEGLYGICENCGNPIDAARLKAFPRMLMCLDCKRRDERTR